MLTGVFLSAGIFSAVGILYKDAFSGAGMLTQIVSKITADKSIPEKEAAVVKDVPRAASIPAQGKAIRVDLENGNIALYEDSQFLKSFSAVAIPDEFSPWRIPQGAYAVKALEAEHYSPLAGTSFPNAVLFSDNGLIRAETNNDGQAAAGVAFAEKNEAAGIVLSAENAAELFDFADEATEVIILNEVPESRVISYDEALRGENAALSRASPRISARAALAADLDTGEVFFEKLPDLALPIASISKLFTAVVAEELLPLGKIVRISPRVLATYGGSGELSIGDAFSVRELLYPLLIESSNDVAEAFAETAGREQFIAAMNALAEKLGLTHSSFKDPSGLSFGNTSTARDLFLFAQFLLSAEGGSSSGGKEHADILTISKTPIFKAPANELRAWARTWRSNNEFVRDGNPYLIGSKNGYTDEAAQTTVSLFALPVSETKARRVAVILLGSHNREGDALALLKESGGGTLYKKDSFADVFRKKAENYAREKEKQSPEFRLAFIKVPPAALVPENASKIFESLLYLKSYDAVVADIEGIFSDTGYNIAGDTAVRAPREILREFLTIGVDVINVANAHAGDWGRSAFGDNVQMLEEKSFLVAGGSIGAADRWKAPVIESGGVRVGFLDISDTGPDWLSEEEYLPSIFSAKDPLLASAIRESARDADHLVVSITSDDARDDAVARREALARATIDTGARVVVVLSSAGEPYQETYKGGMIFYGQRSLTPLEIVFDKKGIIKMSTRKQGF